MHATADREKSMGEAVVEQKQTVHTDESADSKEVPEDEVCLGLVVVEQAMYLPGR